MAYTIGCPAFITNLGIGYTDGTYNNVPLVNITGTGVGALAQVIIAGGVITFAIITTPGAGYLPTDVFTFNNAFIGGTGTGFTGEYDIPPSIQPCNLLCNVGFECPVITTNVNTGNMIPEGSVPCWDTTVLSGNIEYWILPLSSTTPGPFTGISGSYVQSPLPYVGPPLHGKQYAEINSDGVGRLFQDFTITPGTTIVISFAHAGRISFPNSMQVYIGDSGTDTNPLTLIPLGPTGGYTGISNPPQWTYYTIQYTIPAGSSNKSLIFEALSGGAGGNWLDQISIQLLAPAVIASTNSPVSVGDVIQLTASTIPGGTAYVWTDQDDNFISGSQNPSFIATSGMLGTITYTVTAVDSNGCMAVDTIDVTVVTPPCDLIVVASSNSTCLSTPLISDGDTLQLFASTVISATSYFWTGPNGFSSGSQNPFILSAVSSLNAGIYTVLVTDALTGCTTTDTVEICIVAPPCYIITDCNDVQTPFVTTSDLSAYVGLTVQTCIGESLPTVKSPNDVKCYKLTGCCDQFQEITITIPDNPGDYTGQSIIFPNLYPGVCWLLEMIPCTNPLPINYVNIDFNTEPFTLYNDCSNCLKSSNITCPVPVAFYQFTNCCDPQNILIVGSTSDSFSSNIGLTVQLSGSIALGNNCWQVESVPQGTNTSLSIITINPTINLVVASSADCSRALCNCGTFWPDGCYCVSITLAPNCIGGQVWPGQIYEVFPDCITCAPKCYILTDCAGIEPSVVASNNFAAYVGQVVQLENCGDHCWLVEEAPDCDDSSCVPPVIASFATCVLCLPPVIPVPAVELHPRRVKPGYYTLGCSTEYTERIYCTFAEAVFDEMAKVRYGISVCCDESVDKWDIKKQELDLRALYDPELCKSTLTCCDPCVVSCIAPTNAIAIIS